MVDEPSVAIGLKEIYRELLGMRTELTETRALVQEIPDHTRRLRVIERWMWTIHGATGSTSLTALVLSLIGARHG